MTFPAESEARTVNVYEPPVVGFPERMPVLESDRPGGEELARMVHS